MTASVKDIAIQLRRTIDDPAETEQVTAWIELAEIAIRKRYPNLDQLIADGRLKQRTVDLVEAMAVARYARNPEGTTSKSTRIDDYQETVGTTNSVATIDLLDSEWALLEPSDYGASGAFTITPARRRPR
jgi:hypothetical protein